MSGTFDDGILVALLWIGWSLSSINHHLRQSNRKAIMYFTNPHV